MCRSVYRDMAKGSFKPFLKERDVDQTDNIVLLDYTESPFPPVDTKWQHLFL